MGLSALTFILSTGLSSLTSYVLPVVDVDPSSEHINGTAFLIAPDTAMTAAHVVDDQLGALSAVQCGDTRIYGSVTKVAVDYDLALITLQMPCLSVKVVELAKDSPEPGARVSVVGYPGGLKRIVTAGVISTLDFFELQGGVRLTLLIDAKIFGGNSGSPLLYEGKVIGLVTGRICLGGNPGGQPPECYGVVTPIILIHMFLQRDAK